MRSFVLFFLLALAACDGGGSLRTAGNPLDEARAAIVARNFGEASELAAKAVEQDPKNPAAHYELARAQALQGNEGKALTELGLAIDRGLADPARALEDSAFDQIRDGQGFEELVERASPRRTPVRQARRPAVAPEPEPEVEIRSEGGREVIRAGDVVIDTDI